MTGAPEVPVCTGHALAVELLGGRCWGAPAETRCELCGAPARLVARAGYGAAYTGVAHAWATHPETCRCTSAAPQAQCGRRLIEILAADDATTPAPAPAPARRRRVRAARVRGGGR